MKNEKNGFIYILTNESFHMSNWIKIGYSNDVERRVKELSRTSVPIPYEVYATYEIPESRDMERSDKQLHALIESLNPKLRLAENKEFFQMEPEDAYSLLYSIAKIHGREEKLVDGVGRKRFLEDSNKNENIIHRTILPKMDWLIEQKIVKIGDQVCVRNYEDKIATIVSPTEVEYLGKKMTFNNFGCKITGWKSIQTYAFLHLVGDDETLMDKRERRMRELKLL